MLDLTKTDVIVTFKRLYHGFTRVILVLVSLAMFFASVMTFHKPEVIARLLLRTPEGYLQLLILFATSMLPLICVVLISRRKAGQESKFVRVMIAGAVTGFYIVSTSLLYYRIETGTAFDPTILWYHFEDAVRTLLVLSRQQILPLALIAAIALCHFHGLLAILSQGARELVQSSARQIVSNLLVIGSVALLMTSQWYSVNGMWNLILESHRGASQARSIYNKYFDESIRLNQLGLRSLPENRPDPNLFIVQLESINASLVSPVVTPNLLAIAEETGVLFPRIQATSVFTVLSMETILCATLPTLEKNLARMDSVHSRLVCLPRILKERGFKTLYFQAYPDSKFNNMDQFFRSIGFDEIHADDIMKPGDASLKWGFVEDVFYRRVFEYLEKFRDQKIFVYIVAGSANHYPFFDTEIGNMFASLKTRLPFQAPSNPRERMANTMFIQDHFFGEMYQQYYSRRFGNTSQMFVLGDHSWPLELHVGNGTNLKGAFQENFVTTMAFLPQQSPRGAKAGVKGRSVQRLYSYFDLPATVLEMYGVDPHYAPGESFLAELERTSPRSHGKPNRCLLSVQPFSGGQIVVINYPTKRIFDLKDDSVSIYNLATDPNELNTIDTVKIDGEHLALLESCLRALIARGGPLQESK